MALKYCDIILSIEVLTYFPICQLKYRSGHLTDNSIIRNLIFAIQQVTIMQEWLKWLITTETIFLLPS